MTLNVDSRTIEEVEVIKYLEIINDNKLLFLNNCTSLYFLVTKHKVKD